MHAGDIILIVFGVIAIVAGGLFLLNRWSSKKMVEQRGMIEQNKQTAQVFVIDKKRDRIANVNMPKAVMAQVPRMYRFMRLYFVQVKVGPQIATMMCEKAIYNYLQAKKTYKVDVAGLSIVAVKGMKSAYEVKEAAKDKKKKEKLAEESAKATDKLLRDSAKQSAKKKV